VTRRALGVLALGAALVFLAGLGRPGAELWRPVVKPIPALALAALVAGPGGLRRALAAGLLLSAAGDLLLELPGHFVAGLAAFLAAHLAYATGFLLETTRPAAGRLLPVAAWMGGTYAFLWPGLGSMAVPVGAYVVAIGAMIWRAAARVGARGPARKVEWLGLAGALTFALSDTLIALDRFHAPLAGVRYPIMTLYWVGQGLIAASAAEPA